MNNSMVLSSPLGVFDPCFFNEHDLYTLLYYVNMVAYFGTMMMFYDDKVQNPSANDL